MAKNRATTVTAEALVALTAVVSREAAEKEGPPSEDGSTDVHNFGPPSARKAR
jgi:hypothetical protein